MLHDYERLAEKISKASGLEKEEINRKVEAKRAKLSGLISKEGAAQIVAAELGINFDKEKFKINELMPGMKKANLVGKITKLFPVIEYKKENRGGKVANLIIADETGNIKVVLWDTNHIALIEKNQIKENDVVEINNGNMRESELHLTGFSDIKKSNELLENIKIEREFNLIKLNDVRIGQALKTRAFIVQMFEPRFFEICPECKKKVISAVEGSHCEIHGKVIPEKRALLSLILDDGADTIRSVLFSEQIEQLEIVNLEGENFLKAREELLGKEMFFSGTIRQNKLFNNMELFVSEIKNIEIDKLIEELEKVNK